MPSVFTEEYDEFRKRLVHARKEAGLTQEDVAYALSKPQPFVSKVERGERRLDAVELAHFAELYGKPLSYFLGHVTGTHLPRSGDIQ